LAGYCAYLDVENAMDPSLAESMGVNTENLLISRPSSAEKLLCVVNTLTKSGAVDVIVVDSVSDYFLYLIVVRQYLLLT
jgi:RecA/RadA recombinase